MDIKADVTAVCLLLLSTVLKFTEKQEEVYKCATSVGNQDLIDLYTEQMKPLTQVDAFQPS